MSTPSSPQSDSTESDQSENLDAAREALTPEQFQVTQCSGTEPAFSGAFWDLKDDGTYRCVVCSTPLFVSDTKYDSGSGWPSFWDAIDPARVTLIEDRTHGMVRVEARCATCDAHLGHLFPDGPRPTGQRYCINSASLSFDPAAGASDAGASAGASQP